jgi:hypothetical protein
VEQVPFPGQGPGLEGLKDVLRGMRSAGSIADEAIPSDKPLRTEVENLLIQLGDLQLAAQIVNPRTEMWVHHFENWQRLGLKTKQT